MIDKYLKQKKCKVRFLIGPNSSGKTYVMKKHLSNHEGESLYISEEGNLDIKMNRTKVVVDLKNDSYILYPNAKNYGKSRSDDYQQIAISERLKPLLNYCFEQILYYDTIRFKSKGQEKIYNIFNILYKTLLNPIRIIFFDEPENFLDDLGLRKITKLFQLIEKSNIKLIISSHNFNLCSLLKVPIGQIFFIRKEFDEVKTAYKNLITCISYDNVKKLYIKETNDFDLFIKGKNYNVDPGIYCKMHLYDNPTLFSLFLKDCLTSEQFYRALFYTNIVLVEGATEKRIIDKLDLSGNYKDTYFFISNGKSYIPFWASLFTLIGKNIKIIIDSDEKKLPQINKISYGITCYLNQKYFNRVIAFNPDLEGEFRIDITKYEKYFKNSKSEKKLYASDDFFQNKINLNRFIKYIDQK